MSESENRFVRRFEDVREKLYPRLIANAGPSAYFRMEGADENGFVRDEVTQAKFGKIAWPAAGRKIFPIGRVGRAISFRGPAHGDYLRIPSDSTAALDFAAGSARANAFSIVLWTKAGFPQSESCGILARGLGHKEQLVLDIYKGAYRFFVRDAVGAPSEIRAAVGPNGSWQHLAAIYDPENLRLSLWIDGKRAGSSPARPTLLKSDADMILGGRADSSPEDMVYFRGLVDEAATFPRALSDDEITGPYHAGRD